MPRIAELDLQLLSPEQARVRDILMSGPRGGVGGPFKVLLHQPSLAETAQSLGLYLREKTSLPKRLIELAVLFETQYWCSEYPLHVHRRLALEAGLDEAIVDAIGIGIIPPFVMKDEAALFSLLTELHDTKRVSDATFATAVQEIGELPVLDAVSLAGYYALISMVANVYELKPPLSA